MEALLITNIIKLLKTNKGYPNYQAERRIDVFINYFLERILSEYLGEQIYFSCPEFPLKTNAQNSNVRTKNLSTKLDYLCHSKDQVFFVELKTDNNSIEPKQLKKYFDNISWSNCLDNFDSIVNGPKRISDYQAKYHTLNEKISPLRSNAFDKAVRIIYLSPLANQSQKEIGIYKIKNLRPFRGLKIQLTETEKIVWDFLSEISMNAFEVVTE